MSSVLTLTNILFLLQGFGLTLYISFISILLSMFFGTLLAIMRNSKNPIWKLIASIYIEFVRNVPNLLWIFIIFLVFQMKSVSAGITSFTIFTSAALAEIIRGGLNGVDKGQTEAGLSQGFTYLQVFIIIIFPQAFRKMITSHYFSVCNGYKRYITTLFCYSYSRNLRKKSNSNGKIFRSWTSFYTLRYYNCCLFYYKLYHFKFFT
ncbi:TPA: amino acid ABC transporter permease [Streptococcus agalactiae]